MPAIDRVSAFISSVYITPIKCPSCGESAHLMHRQGIAKGAELRTFECEFMHSKNRAHRARLGSGCITDPRLLRYASLMIFALFRG